MSATFPTPDDANAIRGLILAQLAAFAADDAERAFSFASPLIQAHFATAAVFLDMVREYYPDVYRARGAAFGVLRGDGGHHAVQIVRLLDDAGGHSVACYELSREGGPWRINGCVQGLWLSEPEQ
jgi:hypothetical protein